MFLCVLIRFVDWDVALSTQNRSILLAKQESLSLLHHYSSPKESQEYDYHFKKVLILLLIINI